LARVDPPSEVLEAVIFSAGGPASIPYIRRALPRLTPTRIAELVREINGELRTTGRPYEVVEVAGGYQFRSRPEFADVLAQAQPERKLRLSRAALETLSVVAYKQPVTRAEIEDLRCVDCGAVLKGLLDRNLVRIVGRRDAPGRPGLYGTSSTFLETFGLGSLSDLPELRDLLNAEPTEGTPIAEALDEEAAPGDVSGDDDPRDARSTTEDTAAL
jgi:segregation and condensation protein B